jgi:predicted AAA+ superfamily ATPase
LNRGSREKFYFWRDSNGNEVDLLSVLGDKIKAYEIKSNKTARKKFSDNLVSFRNVANINPQDTAVIYGGSEKYIFNNTDYLPVASHKVC